ncbi:MAG: GNAT family N-acetyltransferase [Anaerolineales bacterium]|nr:GNAT family N-acetyltransferase [Anaerolineales bacterium]
MLQELDFQEFENVHSLFNGFNYSLSIRAVLDGGNPGRIFVDDPGHPRLAFALTIEGYLLAGEYSDPDLRESMRQFFQDSIFTGQVYLDSDESITLAVHPQEWADYLPELIPTHEVEALPRYRYLCTELDYAWREHLPDGYTVHRMDRFFLDDDLRDDPDDLIDPRMIKIAWDSLDNFLAHGAGFYITHGGAIVSSCTADCRCGDQIDIGAETSPAHRHQGLATIVTAATVEYCFQKGYRRVGWHCNTINVGSWKTAEKVGFKRQGEYTYYYYMRDPLDHLAELGWHYYQLGDHEKTRQYYERLFAARTENPDYYYYLAASVWGEIKNAEKATRYLLAAVERGWSNLAHLKNDEDFRFLHGTPIWESILERIEQNEKNS